MLINACYHLCAELFPVRMFSIPPALVFARHFTHAINQLIQESSLITENWNNLFCCVYSATSVYGGIIYF